MNGSESGFGSTDTLGLIFIVGFLALFWIVISLAEYERETDDHDDKKDDPKP